MFLLVYGFVATGEGFLFTYLIYYLSNFNKSIIGLLFNTMNTLSRVAYITGEGGEKQSLSSHHK